MLTLTTDVFASPALLFIKTSGTFGSFLLSTVQNVLRKQKTLYQLKFLQITGLMWTFTISTGCHSAICESSLTSKNFAGNCGLQAKNNTITFINFMLPLFFHVHRQQSALLNHTTLDLEQLRHSSICDFQDDLR